MGAVGRNKENKGWETQIEEGTERRKKAVYTTKVTRR
jgi:hypothetical protein